MIRRTLPLIVIKISLILLAIAYALSLKGTWHFMLDNLTSFKVHFAALFFLCAILCLVARDFRWFGFAVLGTVVSIAPVIEWYLPADTSQPMTNSDVVTVMSVNVSPRIASAVRLEQQIRNEQPDILGLIELTPAFAEQLDGIRSNFRFVFEEPKEGFDGLGLYSNIPILEGRLAKFSPGAPPAISAILDVESRDTEVLIVHPVAPISEILAKKRNEQLEALADYIAKSPRRFVVLADLNTALWSDNYQRFVRDSGLRNSRRGFGVESTWPATKFLGVAIDHIFHSPDIPVRDFRVLSTIGSDHLPVIADLGLIGQECGTNPEEDVDYADD
jgi:endonuclease/exonuclease/phosphatase (EEP) superfamily protein YafD